MSHSHEKIAMIGLFGAISIVLGVMENFLPTPIPGIRLGLANLGVMIMLYLGGVTPAFLVMLLKVTLVPLLSGNLIFRLSLSVPSGMAAMIAMALIAAFLSKHSSAVAAGVAGASLHMITQLWIIDWLYIRGLFSTSIVGWFLLAAVCTGTLTGVIANVTIKRLRSRIPGRQTLPSP